MLIQTLTTMTNQEFEHSTVLIVICREVIIVPVKQTSSLSKDKVASPQKNASPTNQGQVVAVPANQNQAAGVPS